jgi:hypothetical protein
LGYTRGQDFVSITFTDILIDDCSGGVWDVAHVGAEMSVSRALLAIQEQHLLNNRLPLRLSSAIFPFHPYMFFSSSPSSIP